MVPATPLTPADLLLAPIRRMGAANVIMQLSLPPIGYGVIESRVDSGNLMLHPLHRLRTTGTYLAVALMGDEQEKRAYRRAVGRSHAQVVSTESSPVAYNAFDRDLQLWVAACIYTGLEDLWGLLVGRPGMKLPDGVYRECATLGTTLQVRPEQWPADRAAFEEYWNSQLEKVSIDADRRTHFESLMRREHLRAARHIGARSFRFYTTGFLREPFRSMMGLTWTEQDQEEFEAAMARSGRRVFRLPPRLRAPQAHYFLADMRRRIRAGRPLI